MKTVREFVLLIGTIILFATTALAIRELAKEGKEAMAEMKTRIGQVEPE